MNNTLPFIKDACAQSPKAFIMQAEQEYHEEIRSLAQTVSDNDDIKIVAIAGPSASGKTTTAHILQEKLTGLGEKTEVISLDDFYLPNEQLPLLPDGRQDIESVNALDKEQIRSCLLELIKTGKTWLPRFSFPDRRQIRRARYIDLSGKGIAIVEGLHALNPVLTELIPGGHLYKLYISVNSPIRSKEGTKLL
ncbi:MAG: nucleoside kinase, partial [Clostridia bacterium]|nr:nucleoside kinase [Clostridia bacterium]